MSGAAASRGGVGLVVLLGVLGAFGPLSMDLYMPSLPSLARELHTTDALAQLSMSVCMIGLGAGQLVVGPLSDRVGRRAPVLVGVAGFAIGSLACSLAPTIGAFLALRGVQGLCGSAGIVIALSVARDLYSGRALVRLLSMLALVGSSAPILAPVAGGLLAGIMDWRGVFLVLSGVGAVIFLGALWLPESLPAPLRHSGGLGATGLHVAALFHDRVFMWMLTASTLSGIAFFGYLSMISFVLQDGFGLSPQLFSVAFAGNAVCELVGSQSSRWVTARLGVRRTYLLAQTGLAASAVLLLVAVFCGLGVVGVLAATMLFMLSIGVGGPNGSTLQLESHAARVGTAAAVIGVSGFVVGPLVAPLASLGGITAERFALTFAAGMLSAALVAWTLARPALLRRSRAAA